MWFAAGWRRAAELRGTRGSRGASHEHAGARGGVDARAVEIDRHGGDHGSVGGRGAGRGRRRGGRDSEGARGRRGSPRHAACDRG